MFAREIAVRPTVLVALVAIALGLAPAVAAPRGLTAQDVNSAELKANGKAAQAANIKAQVLLDRAGFSPGAIDGREGENFENALRAFQKKNALGESGKLDQATWDRLTQNAAPALIDYTITAVDVKGPFAEKIPAKYEEKAKLKRLDYTSAAEMLAERFHMDQEFLGTLNPGKDLDEAGSTILVANVNVKPVSLGAKAARLEVDKQNNQVRVLGSDGALLAAYPASVGSEEKPAPSGTLKVVRAAQNPTYTYNPEFKFRGVKADRELKIAPGPNNPVGLVWIALDQKTYGIHGTSEPSRIGKTESHGCVRLTNWDALALAKVVRKGMPVEFID
ncbi:MAG: murein L,D-transpeptidase [Alphaproteobacteria bacterium]|nr:MAG: murein L,D-transpeptidase [Alphaproteobacteria bacterium]